MTQEVTVSEETKTTQEAAEDKKKQTESAQTETTTQEVKETGQGDQVHQLRQEAANYRTKLRNVESQLQEAQTKGAEQVAALTQQVADLTAKHQAAENAAKEASLRAAVTRAAAGKFADVEDAWINLDKAAIEYDDKGAPKNLDALLGGILQKKPYLAGLTRTSVGPSNPSRSDGQLDELAQRLLKRGRGGSSPF